MNKNLVISFVTGFILSAVLIFSFARKRTPVASADAPVSQTQSAKCVAVSTVKTNPDGSKEESIRFQSEVSQKLEQKPRLGKRMTIIPFYSFTEQRFYYAAGYEKRYSLPLIGESYLGIFVNSKLDAGVSFSKEF